MTGESERVRLRVSSKIDRLPQSIKAAVDDMLSDNTDSFTDISDWLKEQGHEISRSAVGRYSRRRYKAAQRLAERLEQTRAILEFQARNPDIDVAKAAQAILSNGLMERIATADEEYHEMPLDTAGRLLASIRRMEIAEKKLDHDISSKMELAFDAMAEELAEKIRADPVLRMEFDIVIENARRRLFGDNS